MIINCRNILINCLVVLTVCILQGCSSKPASTEKVKTDKELCSSKQDIVLNRSYYASWKACERLTAQQDYHAEYVLGLLYTDDKILNAFLDSDTRMSEGIAHITNAASHNVPEAAKALGEYYDSIGNSQEAIQWFKISAWEGDHDAMISLGNAYEAQEQCILAREAYLQEIATRKNKPEGWLYLFLLSSAGCGDLKANQTEACAAYHVIVTGSEASLLQSLLAYEEANQLDKENKSISQTVKSMQDYYINNQKICSDEASRIMAGLANSGSETSQSSQQN